MGYKKGYALGTKDGLIWGKYRIGRHHDDSPSSAFGEGCISLQYCPTHKTVSGYKYHCGYCIGAYKTNILRKISFDIEKRNIIIESRKLDKKQFQKVIMDNITNKDFFNYVRNHVEELFGILYEVTPNKDRTVFKLVKRNLNQKT